MGGIDQSGTKSELIERIKHKWAEKSQSNQSIEPQKNEETRKHSDDEDGPVEDWTKAELIDECKTLGIDLTGTRSELIERIKLKWSEKSTADQSTGLQKK